MPDTACKNCNFSIQGNFCSNCGQPANVHRINATYFLHEIPHSIMHVDKGLPYTFWKLITKPAKSLQEYLEGKRIKFFRPLGYVVLMSAISSVLIKPIRLQLQYIYLKRTGKAII